MKLYAPHIKYWLFVCLLSCGLYSTAQKINDKKESDSSTDVLVSPLRFHRTFDFIYHSPEKKDKQRYNWHKSLIRKQPTEKNHELYFDLACSLWELEKINEAERMFLTIINSKEKYYTSTYFNYSDIPGDTTKTIYGYGSYTSNYKNYAAIYLTKIYIKQKKYSKALQYLEDAVNKYKVSFTCGTGFYNQKEEYEFLYASCYEGLERHQEAIDVLLPSCLTRNDDIIIAAINKSYSKYQIRDYLEQAESSIVCSMDTFPSFSYRMTYGNGNLGKIDSISYYSGTATIMLFNRKISIPAPKLENGVHITRESFVKVFKESDFYLKLQAANEVLQGNFVIYFE